MVKRMVWTDRVMGVSPEEADGMLRERVTLPSGVPVEGWKRDNGHLVEICSEPFPGSEPVWFWQE